LQHNLSRNILIYSDGTAQAEGLLPDERRSNIPGGGCDKV
jgi:hypothetical protein